MRVFIFACVHNAGRSQIAAAFFNRLAVSSEAHAISAGTQPVTHIHPVAVEVMREIGIDLTDNKPQKLTEELARGAEMLITMGCGEDCPYVQGVERADWPIPDPKNREIGVAREIRDDIADRVRSLLIEKNIRHHP